MSKADTGVWRTGLIVAALLAALLGALWWIKHTSEGVVTSSARADASRVDVQELDAGSDTGRRSPPPQSLAASAAAPTSSLSAMALVEQGVSARIAEQDLLARGEQGDALALAALLELHDKCASFYNEDVQKRPARHVENLPLGTPELAARSFALDTLQSYCDRPYGPGEYSALSQGIRAKLQEAALRGDIAASAALGFKDEREASKLMELLRNAPDPWVAERAMQALVSIDGEFRRDLQAEVFGNRLSDMTRRADIASYAARWYGCEMGAPCGANQAYELNECLYAGNCGIGLDVRGFIRQRVLSGQEYELMQRYLEALRRRLHPPAGSG